MAFKKQDRKQIGSFWKPKKINEKIEVRLQGLTSTKYGKSLQFLDEESGELINVAGADLLNYEWHTEGMYQIIFTGYIPTPNGTMKQFDVLSDESTIKPENKIDFGYDNLNEDEE